MNISSNTVVTMQYKVTNAQGQLLDKAQQPTSYLHGGYDNTFPKIEAALEGQAAALETGNSFEKNAAFPQSAC